MNPDTMVGALTDFGYTRWQSSEMLQEFPGLLAKGFQPTGRFGIGFFAVFMVADEVEVRSLAYDEAPRSTHVLEFHNAVAGRPLLRRADPHEQLRSCGTVVRARLRHDPLSMDGLFKTTKRSLTATQLLHSRLIRMCALTDVDISVQGPEDPHPVRILQAEDWIRIPAGELFRRLYRREEASYLDRVIYDGYEKMFIDHAIELRNSAGEIIGRAMMASGFEAVHPDLRWMRPAEAMIYVGGLHADEIHYFMGAFRGEPLTADRLRAFPLASLDEFRSWVEVQADTIRDSPWTTPFDRRQMELITRAFGAVAPRLPCALSAAGPLDRDGLREWLGDKDEVLLISDDSIEWHDDGHRPPVFFTWEGRQIEPSDKCLFVTLNPPWLFPEEVLARPRDERFESVVEPSSAWDPRTWWYDTGNFGAPGLVVRTIADLWCIDIVRAVNLMEPLHLERSRDLRCELNTTDNGTVRVAAIRMRRPDM